ncbi:MAG: DUF6448 family protein [Gammaproteobacteria bacterium]
MNTALRFPARKQALVLVGVVLVERAAAWLLGYESPLGAGGDAGLLLLAAAAGHCDTIDGPLVTLAKLSLEDGKVNRVLAWVPADNEAEVRHAFEHAQVVRKLGPEAKRVADHHFIETLVRLHRAGEGAPYTGLKPAGLDHGPAVPAADRALAEKSIEKAEALAKMIGDAVRDGLISRFRKVVGKKDYDLDDVKAGREYVDAYVSYVHYAEGAWQAASRSETDAHAGHAKASGHAHEHVC